jgi:site-specific DNA-adenine methylase
MIDFESIIEVFKGGCGLTENVFLRPGLKRYITSSCGRILVEKYKEIRKRGRNNPNSWVISSQNTEDLA